MRIRATTPRTTAELFGSASNLLHATFALRYPVFIGTRNYSGSPKIRRSHLLTDLLTANLPAELEKVPDALIVPLGKAVEEALGVIGMAEAERTLQGFPHPSGANGHRVKQFQRERSRLREVVGALNPNHC